MVVTESDLAGVDVQPGSLEIEMTTPAERTRSVRGTRQFLEILASHTGQLNHCLVRTLAIQLLRHFPSDADIALSSSSLPTLWGTVQGDYCQGAMSVHGTGEQGLPCHSTGEGGRVSHRHDG
ncbi:BPSL0761 family protein [Burkholderia sp. A9]|uniref:BPSL0761 family protein n=1 Tax=Burkholderia sp. A9 TaxID=1365108 RepID=UPI002E11E986